MACRHGICRVFGPGASKFAFSRFSAGTKTMRDEKLCRFVVVSPREVPSLPFSCPFKIFNFRSFLKPLPFACFNSGSLVFTKFCHQPYGRQKHYRQIKKIQHFFSDYRCSSGNLAIIFHCITDIRNTVPGLPANGKFRNPGYPEF